MDLVFSRYSSPLFFLDYCIESGTFENTVEFLIKKKDEEKWWNLYLATLPLNDKSYDEWKKECQGNSKNNETTNLSKDEIDTVIKNSQDILSGFKPPQ